MSDDEFLDLASFEEARASEPEFDKDFEDRRFFTFAVRGRVFHPGVLDHPKVRGEAWFELVPEPHNPHDACAVAIDHDGQRIGYVYADFALWLHGYIRAANIHGYRCRVPGFIVSSQSAWYVIKSFDWLNDLTGYADIVERIAAIRAVVEHGKSKPKSLRPSYSQRAADAFWAHRDMDPEIFPDAHDPELYRAFSHRAEIILRSS